MSISQILDNIAQKGPAFEDGHVWLAGAGPGDVRYLTLDVALALGQADIIVRDALVSDEVLALGAQAEIVFAGKRGGKPSAVQDDITASLIDFAREGKKVLRLKGGDPFIFGRGGEEIEALREAGIPFRVLPGMTSSFTALAAAGIPATMRGISRAITLATGHAAGTEDDLDWLALAKTKEPIVVYMGLKNIGTIAGLLMAGGRSGDTPVAVIMAATTAQERIFIGSLKNIADDAKRENFEAPALIVIGDIVSMRHRLGIS